MVTVGGVWDTPLTPLEALNPLAKAILEDPTIINPRRREIYRQQTTTGSQVAIAELATITISNIGRTELTLVGAASANDNDYDGDSITITYKDNEGVLHNASMDFNTANSTTEVAFTKEGDDSNGVNEDGAGAVTDFYCLVSMTSSQAAKGGHTFGIGTAGVLTYGVIQAAASTAVAADIHGVGDVFVRGNDNSASMQSKAHILKYMTPWGEIKTATSTTGADSTTETRFTGADASTLVSDFYRVMEWYVATVPAGGKYVILTDADCGNVNGAGGDVYGAIEEAIKQSIHSNLYASTYRRTFIHNFRVDMPQLGVNEFIAQILCTPLGASQAIIIGASGIDTTELILDMEVEPDSEITYTIADKGNAGLADVVITMYHGINATYWNKNVNGKDGLLWGTE